MNNRIVYLIVAIALWSLAPAMSISAPIADIPKEYSKIDSAKAYALVSRLDEIKAIDLSSMEANEKRKLRKEVRSIKKTLSEIRGGVYLSVGAIIIIILLLILLL